MSNIYKTYDYSYIPIHEIEDKDLCNFSKIANLTIKDLCDNKNANLLIFPKQLDMYKDGIADSKIFTINTEELQTGDLMGFIGINDSQLTISSRFTKNSEKDYFLHFMMQKVFNVNILNLIHSTSNEKILDFLIYMFPHFLKKALKQGVYKKYTARNYNNANVRGAINIASHIKFNNPFNGKIAYRTKEYTSDNDLTQLIRHTIEYIRASHLSSILKSDADTEAYVSQICNITPSYQKSALQSIIKKNQKLTAHPYYTEYRTLQQLCIHILQQKKLKYGIESRQIYGILFSGSWLWEEFLYKTVLAECGFDHPQNKAGRGGIYLFESRYSDFSKGNIPVSRCKRYPDYIKDNCIMDAKYKHLDNNRVDRNDMHQIISYMHVEKAAIGGFIYPAIQNDITVTLLGHLRGYGGRVYNIGVPIPKEMDTYATFKTDMGKVLHTLKNKILDIC